MRWRCCASYAHYLRQIGTPYTQRYVEQVLAAHPAITGDLAALFAVQFDPDLFDRATRSERDRRGRAAIAAGITAALDAVTSLDADRILRTYAQRDHARPTRTNEYRLDDDGNRRDFLSVKLDPHQIPGRAETRSGA